MLISASRLVRTDPAAKKHYDRAEGRLTIRLVYSVNSRIYIRCCGATGAHEMQHKRGSNAFVSQIYFLLRRL